MAATRPGNPERGWNDPPMFMYNKDGQKSQPSPRKNPLTLRVGMHQSHTSKILSTGVKAGLPQTVSPRAPPVSAVPPVQAFSNLPTEKKSSPTGSAEVQVQGQGQLNLPDDICGTTITKLKDVLKLCEEKLKTRVADDIKKRIDVLNAAWTADKLCAEVQHRMAKLSAALADRDYDRAHDVHLSLMVDYVSEVSQWMVGIKRLIMEARTILPTPTPALETQERLDRKQQIENSALDDKEGTAQSEEAAKDPSVINSEDNQEALNREEVSLVKTEQSATEEHHNKQASPQDDTPRSEESASDSQPTVSGSPNDADDRIDAAGDNMTGEQLGRKSTDLGMPSTDLAKTVESEGTYADSLDSKE